MDRTPTPRQREIWRTKGRYYVTPTRPHLPGLDEYSVHERQDPDDWARMPPILGCYLTEAEAGALWRRLMAEHEAEQGGAA